jgi:hypothetical protein
MRGELKCALLNARIAARRIADRNAAVVKVKYLIRLLSSLLGRSLIGANKSENILY